MGSVVLAGLPGGSAASTPRAVVTGRLERAVARARSLAQLNALIIAVDGEARFAEAATTWRCPPTGCCGSPSCTGTGVRGTATA